MSILSKDEQIREQIYNAFKSSLARAKFSEPDVRKMLNKLLSTLESDLDACDWSPGNLVEDAAERLQDLVDQLEKEEIVVVRDEEPTKVEEEDDEPLEIIELPNSGKESDEEDA